MCIQSNFLKDPIIVFNVQRVVQVYAGCLNPDSGGSRQLGKNGQVMVLKMDVTKEDEVIDAFNRVKKDLAENSTYLSINLCNATITLNECELKRITAWPV